MDLHVSWSPFSIGLVAMLAASGAAAQNHKLNGPLSRGSGAWIHDVRIGPGGGWVVYATTSESPGLFAARIEGGASAVRLVPQGTSITASP